MGLFSLFRSAPEKTKTAPKRRAAATPKRAAARRSAPQARRTVRLARRPAQPVRASRAPARPQSRPATQKQEFVTMAIAIRQKKNITQAELARRMNTKQSAISRLERGTYNPSIAFLRKLADALDVKMRITLS